MSLIITAIGRVTNLDASHGSPKPLPFRYYSICALRCYFAMALVDFHQLAILCNLSRSDAGAPSIRSHPPPMSATIPLSSRPSVVDPGQTSSPPFPPTRSLLKTPERTRDVTRPVPHSTPIAVGTSIMQKLEPDTDEVQKGNSAKYEEYIIRDFERHRVFVDIDVFMTRVLHVPENWRELWGRTIRRVKRDSVFSTALWDYARRCGTQAATEQKFYKPLVDMGNAILDFSESSPDDSVKPRTPQRYLRNDPRKVLCGVINNLSPDVVAAHDNFLPHIRPEERETWRLKKSNLTSAQPLQALEVKPWDSALVDGSCMPRLKVNGEPLVASRDGILGLTGNRTRPTAGPYSPLYPIAVPEERYGPHAYLHATVQPSVLSSRRSSCPKTACR